MSCSPGLGQSTCTTAEHPFYVDGRGWVRAGELHACDMFTPKAAELIEKAGLAAGRRVATRRLVHR
jgi:hypothetical protein